ncbi:hypothetical protein EV644_11457 [Kribbella orskensis]|uniref:Integral membrane protein DUF2269 n=1 Tax=Kribbella orskensis TaxID=2512216 RepID=A0ABY2BDV7_9ACTN|nr:MULTISPECIES: hypothetical protein [Kribbella]TCN35802.1 hypothetical protein EV642_11557 [Kribbella sp. VKM Ac-2500]TCO17409.1 hypothetical protein EV644_11457 [Kribbella orskensis]
MNKVLLSVHVLAAIIFVGPVTVAASMFPPIARRSLTAGTESAGVAGTGDVGVLRVLHRISRGYAIGGLTVPVFGLAVGAGLGVLGDYWLIISMVLTLAAAGVLAFVVLPGQSRVLAAATGSQEQRAGSLPQAKALSMTTGIFALLWAVVVVLMIVRPGSTTGA